MKKFIFILLGCLLAVMGVAIAQDVAVPATNEEIQSIWNAILALKGASGMALVSGIIFLLIGLLKVSFLKPVWSKLGKLQPWLAPGLGVLAAIASAFLGEGGFSWDKLGAGFMSGAGSIAIAELFDRIKAVPGVGKAVTFVIALIEKVLLKPKK